MLILLPYPDMEKSAKVFSPFHLVKTTESVSDILKFYKVWECRAFLQKGTLHNSFYNDIELWKNCIEHLKIYANVLYFELCSRNIKHNFPYPPSFNLVCRVPWWWCEDYHQSHQAFLLRENFDHYSQFFNIWEYKNKNLYWPHLLNKV